MLENRCIPVDIIISLSSSLLTAEQNSRWTVKEDIL